MMPPRVDAPPGEGAADLLTAGDAGGRAIKGAAVRVTALALSVLFSIGSSAILYRHLGIVGSGDYLKITSLVTLTAGLTDAGLSAIGVREFSTRDREGRRAFLRDISGLRLLLSGVGVAVAVAFAAVAGYGGLLTLGTAIAGAGMVLVTLEDTYAIGLIARMRVPAVAVNDLLRVAVLAVLIVVLVLLGSGLLLIFATAIPAAACAAFANARLVRDAVPLRPAMRPRRWREIVRDSIAFSISAAVTAVYFRVALIVVSLVSTGRQTGYFGIAFRVIDVLVSLPVLLVMVSFPVFAQAARGDRERLDYAIGRVFDALWLVGVGVALVLLVGAPFVIDVIAGSQAAPADVVLRIQGVALMASFVGSVWTFALLSLHRHRQILVVSLIALVCAGVSSGVLASIDGARGAAIGTAVSEVLFVLMLAGAAYRAGLRPWITWRNIPRSMFAAALGAATLLIPGLPSVARLAIGVGLYGAALLVLRAIPQEILQMLPRPRRSA